LSYSPGIIDPDAAMVNKGTYLCRVLSSVLEIRYIAQKQQWARLKEMSQEAESYSAPSIPKYFNYFPYFHE
jgi:hypothetical protein